MEAALALRTSPTADRDASTRPLRILYHHRVVSRDGQSVHVDDMIAALRGLGHDVTIAAPAMAGDDDGEPPRWIARLKRALPAALYEMLELGYNVPAFIRLHRRWRETAPDVIYERYNLNLLAGVWLAKLTHTPLLLEVNAPLAQERASFSGGLRLHPLAWRIENWIWRNADRVLPVSTPLAGLLREACVADERIAIIPNAIDPARHDGIDGAAAKRALGLEGKTILGFSGFMRDWHGLDRVVEAFAKPDLPHQLHFLLLGDGPARAALEARAAEFGVADRVTFAGIVPRADLARHVAAFDIALQPQAVAYASPLKLFDYMAAGKAIVAPDQPNIRELVSHEKSALLFDPQHKNAMIDAILRCAADSGLRRRLGAAARRQIDERGFTWRDNGRRVAALGASLIDGKAGKVR
ncbi:MAG TPA: glycosyltransferase family 4 protein [Stellaceae bacterium]|jgi:glycosyltransferase involved in cell wall biosynthesis|nr:glycosyltransferase family 4 protein [Stellaceae bacterium]